MRIEELKERVLNEIENNLWRLGDDTVYSIFPDFDLNSHELEYGVQRDDSEFIVETKAKNKDGKRILVKIKIDLVAN